jgi:transcriptional regulator GlxA family with amidase domain
VIRPALLSEVAAASACALPVAPAVAPAGEAVQAWSRAYQHVRKTVAGENGAPPPPMVVDALERLLVTATVSSWAQPETEGAVGRGDRDGHPATLRRAIAFIEASPHEDISIEDIADAACVTVRAVQMSFRRHLNTTPMAYLRQVRLACAHAELQTGAAEETVGTIARRWRFSNAGRFAAAYRVAYGHPPLATLRNLRPGG